jgi:cytochrome c
MVKRPYLIAIGIMLLMLGCTLTTRVLPTPTLTPEPTQVPTNTPVPPTDTPEPTPTDTSVPILFRDDFNDVLADGWSWIGEDPRHWSLSDVPGALRIILQPSNMGDGEPSNFLVRDVPEGKYEIATLLHFKPESNFQFAGLLIYESQGSAMQFGRAFAMCGIETVCIGNGIYFDIVAGGGGGKPNFVTAVKSDSLAYLRLRREGTTYTGFYSENGITWAIIGKHESYITPKYVGLIASQAYEAETSADFDYFTVEALP